MSNGQTNPVAFTTTGAVRARIVASKVNAALRKASVAFTRNMEPDETTIAVKNCGALFCEQVSCVEKHHMIRKSAG